MDNSTSFSNNIFKNVNTKVDAVRMTKLWIKNTIENLEDLKEDLELPEDREVTDKMISVLQAKLASFDQT